MNYAPPKKKKFDGQFKHTSTRLFPLIHLTWNDDKTKFRTKDCVLILFPPMSPGLILPFPCDQIPMPQGLWTKSQEPPRVWLHPNYIPAVWPHLRELQAAHVNGAQF